AKDLKPIADPDDDAAGIPERLHLSHDGAEARDGTCAQVVAVAEAPGEENDLDVLEVVVAVPEVDGLGAQDLPGRAIAVVVAVGSGEGDHADLHRVLPSWAVTRTS